MVPFNSGSPQAEAAVSLFNVVFLISLLIFVIVAGGVIFSAIRFRQRPGEGDPPQIEGNRWLEVTWVVVPLFLLGFVSVLTLQKLDLIKPPAPPDPQPDLIVTGYQWWWDVEYPQAGVITANEIHIPTGQRVLLRLKGGDVIHSFWVPELGGKADMVPGHPVYLWLEASQPGTYNGACTEFCGNQHAWMRLRVVAQTPEAYQAWLAAQAKNPPAPTSGAAAQGAQFFQQSTCVNCHAIRGTAAKARVGPDLTHLASRETLAAGVLTNTSDHLAQWLKDPQAVKPGNHMPAFGLSNDQIQQLVAYLETLK